MMCISLICAAKPMAIPRALESTPMPSVIECDALAKLKGRTQHCRHPDGPEHSYCNTRDYSLTQYPQCEHAVCRLICATMIPPRCIHYRCRICADHRRTSTMVACRILVDTQEQSHVLSEEKHGHQTWVHGMRHCSYLQSSEVACSG